MIKKVGQSLSSMFFPSWEKVTLRLVVIAILAMLAAWLHVYLETGSINLFRLFADNWVLPYNKLMSIDFYSTCAPIALAVAYIQSKILPIDKTVLAILVVASLTIGFGPAACCYLYIIVKKSSQELE